MKHVKLFEAFTSTLNEGNSFKKELKILNKEYNKVDSDGESITVWDFQESEDYAVVFTWDVEEESVIGEDQKKARSDEGEDIKTAQDFIDFIDDHI